MSADTNAQPRKMIYLSPPHMGDLEQKYVAEAFASNWIAPLGPFVDAFEQTAARILHQKHAVALSSGTAAIHLALKLIGIKAGDTVFCSSLTFVGSANPILYEGGIPVFIDSDTTSWNLSPIALERAFEWAKKSNRLPKAVIAVNLYGQSADYSKILPICAHYQVPVIEDAAESLGAKYQGKPSGSFGKLSILSFNGNKIINTSGGGMLLSDDQAAIEKARFWATQARDPAPHYQHSEMGYNYRMSNILAAIGLGQIEILETRVQKKQEIFKTYVSELKTCAGVDFMPELPESNGTRWLTTLTLDPKKSKNTPAKIIETLARERIEARPVWKPLHLQPLFKTAPYFTAQEGVDVSRDLFETGICLPSGTSMTTSEQALVIDVLKSLIR